MPPVQASKETETSPVPGGTDITNVIAAFEEKMQLLTALCKLVRRHGAPGDGARMVMAAARATSAVMQLKEGVEGK